jgi:hypothetical protein
MVIQSLILEKYELSKIESVELRIFFFKTQLGLKKAEHETTLY